MNSVLFSSVSALLKKKIKPYHIVRFPFQLLIHSYSSYYQYAYTLPAVLLPSWRERGCNLGPHLS